MILYKHPVLHWVQIAVEKGFARSLFVHRSGYITDKYRVMRYDKNQWVVSKEDY